MATSSDDQHTAGRDWHELLVTVLLAVAAVATFIAWADADRTGKGGLAEFYQRRFRPEFRTAFDAWIATAPFTNPDAAETPFAMPDYEVTAQQEAERLDNESEASAATVRTDIQRASNYVLTVVLYAVTLFFAGMSNQIHSRRLRRAMIVSGYALLGASIAWVATFPVSVAI